MRHSQRSAAVCWAPATEDDQGARVALLENDFADELRGDYQRTAVSKGQEQELEVARHSGPSLSQGWLVGRSRRREMVEGCDRV